MEFTVAGSRVFAATGGRPFDPALPAVLFLHGAGLDHSVWTFQARRFAHRGRSVLALDLPGHGRSAGAPLASIAALADWTVAVLGALDLAEAALVGHSMGGLVALEAAARLGLRARGLALIGTGARMAVHPDLLAAARTDDRRAVEMILAWAFAGRGTVGGHRAPGLWMRGGAGRLLGRAPAGTLAIDLAACDRYADAEAAAAQVRCPAVVVVGVLDRMVPPAAAEALAGKIAGARVATIPGCGHMATVEEPVAVNRALETVV